MNKPRKSPFFQFIAFLIILVAQTGHAFGQEEWEEPDSIMVGRISHIEGQLSRFDPQLDDWTPATREAPFGTEDLLSSAPHAKAEFILPNNTLIRIDGDTQIQLMALNSEVTEVDFPFGMGRLYNRGARTQVYAATPFGRVKAPPGAVFDIKVSEDSVDVTAIEKSVYFIHNTSPERIEVRANSTPIHADIHKVTAIRGNDRPSWSSWNADMDEIWAARRHTYGESATYLPRELHSDAHSLDRHGIWERVYYHGRYYRFWRPVQITSTWSPFTRGAWMVWHGDHVWVPHEPFGYLTHHYGNWIFTSGHWYWAPPVTRIMINAHLPLLRIGFAWYPGRVSWIHYGAYVGWIPLGPYESYYTHRHWGRRSVVVTHKKTHRYYPHGRHRHHDHAVVIHGSHFYRSKDYSHKRVRNYSHSKARHHFKRAMVPDKTMRINYRSHHKRNRYKDGHLHRRDFKPSKTDRGKRQRHYGKTEKSRRWQEKKGPDRFDHHRSRQQATPVKPAKDRRKADHYRSKQKENRSKALRHQNKNRHSKKVEARIPQRRYDIGQTRDHKNKKYQPERRKRNDKFRRSSNLTEANRARPDRNADYGHKPRKLRERPSSASHRNHRTAMKSSRSKKQMTRQDAQRNIQGRKMSYNRQYNRQDRNAHKAATERFLPRWDRGARRNGR